jgi:hypothetical protein
MVQAINGAPKGYKSPGYDKARTLGLDIGKEPKSIVLWENLQMLGTIMGYPLYLMVGQMLKAGH